MKQNTIAIIYDFDGTLTPKTMQEYTLLPKIGVKSKTFWDEISQEVSKTGAETMMVYMRQLLDHAKNKNIRISKDEFLKMGRDIKYYSGVEKWFTNINNYIRKISKNDVNIKHYIISAGHAEILEGISIKKYIKKIFASEYYYRGKVAVFPKIVVTDTTKTQFIFRINKGKEKLSQSINEHMPEADRPIPFDNIIYIGDGMTDVPSMALIKKSGGHSIAVFKKNNKEQIKISKNLYKAQRVDFIAPANYNQNHPLFNKTCLLLDFMVAKIRYNLQIKD